MKRLGEGKSSGRTPRADTTPPDAPNVLPHASQGHDFSIQYIFEMQRTLGGLTEAINTLKGTIQDQNTTLKRHSYILAFASGAVLIMGIVGGFAVNNVWPQIEMLLEMKSDAQQAAAP